MAGCPALASLPGTAGSLAAGRRTLQSRLPASDMLLLGWLEGPEDGRGDSPRRTAGQGIIHPREIKREREG